MAASLALLSCLGTVSLQDRCLPLLEPSVQGVANNREHQPRKREAKQESDGREPHQSPAPLYEWASNTLFEQEVGRRDNEWQAHLKCRPRATVLGEVKQKAGDGVAEERDSERSDSQRTPSQKSSHRLTLFWVKIDVRIAKPVKPSLSA